MMFFTSQISNRLAAIADHTCLWLTLKNGMTTVFPATVIPLLKIN